MAASMKANMTDSSTRAPDSVPVWMLTTAQYSHFGTASVAKRSTATALILRGRFAKNGVSSRLMRRKTRATYTANATRSPSPSNPMPWRTESGFDSASPVVSQSKILIDV